LDDLGRQSLWALQAIGKIKKTAKLADKEAMNDAPHGRLH
jgi:hypothetical protein